MKHVAAALLLLLLIAPSSYGHSMMTAFLEMTEQQDGNTTVSWRRPVFPGTMVTLEPIFPAEVSRVSSEPLRDEGTFSRENFVLHGAPAAWSSCAIGVKGQAPTGLEVLIHLELANGQRHVAVLRSPTELFTVPKRPGFWQAAATYGGLGFDHILRGVDHLLFVFGLLLLVPGRWMLAKTITSFTLAHSITLGIATLGYASAPLPPLNAAIALSIFFLGPELIRKERGMTSLTVAHPWLVAFVFGLLHGFGFASGLSALGLPPADVPKALLFFNLGVEAGQMCFVAVILLLLRSFRALAVQWPRQASALPAYTLGSIGAFWTLQRLHLMFKALS
jgi:hydrogenase/urease accessory protein HupE